MTDTSTLLGPNELRPILADIVQRNPDQVNPKTGFTCRYTDYEDANWHCLVGQLATELGWEVPAPAYRGGTSAAADAFGWPVTPFGRDFLRKVQEQADGEGVSAPPVPWKHVSLD